MKSTIYYYWFARCAFALCDIALLLPLLLASVVARFVTRPIDVGLGSVPAINIIYHKKALEKYGYSAQTFVDSVWYITGDFDHRADIILPGILKPLRPYYLFLNAIFRYRLLYVYFTGGPLRTTTLLTVLEPILLKIAGIKVVVMPFGADVHELTRASNLMFVHAMSVDYPTHRFQRLFLARKIDLWTRLADHVVSGCDWVDYMYHWDTLMLAHFAIDTEEWRATKPLDRPADGRPFRLLHAPNHRTLKGTKAFIKAVEELQREGIDIELDIVESMSNAEVRRKIEQADVVADQLVIGWYAMFAIEAMASGKPVICFLRQDLLDLYAFAGLVDPDEIPIVQATVFNIKSVLSDLVQRRDQLADIGLKSRNYVVKHHSLEAVGGVFDRINRSIGIVPSAKVRDG